MTPEKWIQAWQNRKSIQDTIKLEEELNLLYVAITRTKNQLIIPDSLVASSDLRYKEQLNLV
jgi:ATP-dependent exoDNAse (exonuclease V) beta subunit